MPAKEFLKKALAFSFQIVSFPLLAIGGSLAYYKSGVADFFAALFILGAMFIWIYNLAFIYKKS